jgi:hypothetical protein
MDVKVLMNDVWGPYNEVCEVITVCNPITELRPAFCNSTIASCGTNIYAQSILYAEGYQFSIVGGNINEIITSSANGGFKLQNLVNIFNLTYETTYMVKCRVKVGGVWGAWGEGCSVYLQTNSALTTYCNQTIPAIGTNIFATSVGCASDYRFRINGPDVTNLIYNSTVHANCFRFSQVPGAKFNSTYQVEVSVLVGGQWSPFGTPCFVSTPNTLSISENTNEEANQINTKNQIQEFEFENISAQIDENNFELVEIYPNPSSNLFSLKFNKNIISDILITVIDNSGRKIESIVFNTINQNILELGSNYPNGTYHLIISADGLNSTKKMVKINQ